MDAKVLLRDNTEVEFYDEVQSVEVALGATSNMQIRETDDGWDVWIYHSTDEKARVVAWTVWQSMNLSRELALEGISPNERDDDSP